jgi:hypothetical protein
LLFVNLSLFIGVQMSNIEIGSLKDNYFHIGSTGKTEPTDTYFFSLPTMGSARISAEGFSGDINMELRDKEGRLIKSISTSDKNTGILSIDNLGVADYILNVSPVSGNTNYQVSLTPDGKVDPLTGMGVEAGFFTTDQKGEVGFDLLHDSGSYKGEVAIFSLDGMEKFSSDPKEFIKEAAKRVLSDLAGRTASCGAISVWPGMKLVICATGQGSVKKK